MKINYQKEIDEIVHAINKEAQSKISTLLSDQGEEHLSRSEAKRFCAGYLIFANNLQAELQVKLQDVV